MKKLLTLLFIVALTACVPSVSVGGEALTLETQEASTLATLTVPFDFHEVAMYFGGTTDITSHPEEFACEAFNRGFVCTEDIAGGTVTVPAGMYEFVAIPQSGQPPNDVSASIWYSNVTTGEEYIVTAEYASDE